MTNINNGTTYFIEEKHMHRITNQITNQTLTRPKNTKQTQSKVAEKKQQKTQMILINRPANNLPGLARRGGGPVCLTPPPFTGFYLFIYSFILMKLPFPFFCRCIFSFTVRSQSTTAKKIIIITKQIKYQIKTN